MALELDAGTGIGLDLTTPGKIKVYLLSPTVIDQVARDTAKGALDAANLAQTEVDALEVKVAGLDPFPTGGLDGQFLGLELGVRKWITVDTTGTPGPAGTPGSQWLFGTTAPANTLGIDGDWYINTTNYDIYRKENGAFVLRGNVKGPKGDTGAQGPTGATGAKGDKGDRGSTDVSISFNTNGAAYYIAPVATTIAGPVTASAPITIGGTFAYAYAADGATFAAATFPLSMAAGSVLRVTVSGIGTYAAFGAIRTA